MRQVTPVGKSLGQPRCQRSGGCIHPLLSALCWGELAGHVHCEDFLASQAAGQRGLWKRKELSQEVPIVYQEGWRGWGSASAQGPCVDRRPLTSFIQLPLCFVPGSLAEEEGPENFPFP